jgi:hypothetical protein
MTYQKPYTLIPLFEELRGERVVVRPYRESDAKDALEGLNESRDHLRPWEPFADLNHTVEEKQDQIVGWTAEWLLLWAATKHINLRNDPRRPTGLKSSTRIHPSHSRC